MSTFSPLSMSATSSSPSSPIPSLKRKTMSVTQTYYLAHTARGKLSAEASRSDHNLRLLVGHANLLDSLMLELAEAEQEQESWFNQSVHKAQKTEEPRHIQWADAVVEDVVEVDDSDSSDSEYDSDDEDLEMDADFAPLQRVASYPIAAPASQSEDDEEEGLQLHLTISHSSASSPPELEHDEDDSSEDDMMPPSPPSDALPTFSEKQQLVTTSFYSSSKSAEPSSPPTSPSSLFDEGFYLPQQRQSPTLISAISVY